MRYQVTAIKTPDEGEAEVVLEMMLSGTKAESVVNMDLVQFVEMFTSGMNGGRLVRRRVNFPPSPFPFNDGDIIGATDSDRVINRFRELQELKKGIEEEIATENEAPVESKNSYPSLLIRLLKRQIAAIDGEMLFLKTLKHVFPPLEFFDPDSGMVGPATGDGSFGKEQAEGEPGPEAEEESHE